jgi:hypothetical protein
MVQTRMKLDRSAAVIGALLFLFFISTTLYLNERKHVEETSVLLYNLQVEHPLSVIPLFLAGVKTDSPEWENESFRKDLDRLFYQVDMGLMSVKGEAGSKLHIPESILSQLQSLQEKIT